MRKFNIKVNGKSYAVEVEEAEGEVAVAQAPAQAAVQSTPAPAAASASGTAVNAPMPGLVLKLAVANGATVKKGDKIVILEAMKMENDIVAPAAGVITFAVKQGDTVETGARLASIN